MDTPHFEFLGFPAHLGAEQGVRNHLLSTRPAKAVGSPIKSEFQPMNMVISGDTYKHRYIDTQILGYIDT